MPGIFWFNVYLGGIEPSHAPEAFAVWVMIGCERYERFPVLQGPQEPPFVSTEEIPF